MTDFYPIIQIPDNTPAQLEQQGTKPKDWLHLNKGKHLFKIGRENTGENWAEIVACELCALLGLPHAHYEFAVQMGKKGVLSETFVPLHGRLVVGNELLAEIHSTDPARQSPKLQNHTFKRIFNYLSSPEILLPMDWQPPSDAIHSAVDVFLGYLLLDAWIANQDRHDENWGVIHHDKIYLAPTYDHAASMGQNESDSKRKEMLITKDKGRHISHYIERARSQIFFKKTDSKKMFTLEAFQQFADKKPKAAKVWLQRLGDISPEQCQNVFNRIPPSEISETAIEFAMKLLELNKKRLLEVKP
ncbi:HipA domain-containing protein [Crenothrix polyspora]|uniref:HipA domain-containing protein n=1 Tax=Crenothrix polyspora TaxID=360316 RepID=A0A1R4H919_9GAMM|nr:HipA domain-containing protein [Crenothrix polyspora]SJM92380.1 HipA domain-containing protein [Crenothrix polyspora]